MWGDYSPPSTDGLPGISETKLAITVDGKWHDWQTGGALLGVVCGGNAPPPTPLDDSNIQQYVLDKYYGYPLKMLKNIDSSSQNVELM